MVRRTESSTAWSSSINITVLTTWVGITSKVISLFPSSSVVDKKSENILSSTIVYSISDSGITETKDDICSLPIVTYRGRAKFLVAGEQVLPFPLLTPEIGERRKERERKWERTERETKRKRGKNAQRGERRGEREGRVDSGCSRSIRSARSTGRYWGNTRENRVIEKHVCYTAHIDIASGFKAMNPSWPLFWGPHHKQFRGYRRTVSSKNTKVAFGCEHVDYPLPNALSLNQRKCGVSVSNP